MIAQDGPISLERYMSLALSHPCYGYYTTREPFGAAGDFVTAPEISQMFGELIGLWAVEIWRMGGAPAPDAPCRAWAGTRHADGGRAARDPQRGYRKSSRCISSRQVRVSWRCKELHSRTIAAPVRWHQSIEDIPPGAAIYIANEFFDALPVQHFIRTEHGWCERLVGLDDHGKLHWGLRPVAASAVRFAAPQGSVIEISPQARKIVRILSARITSQGGALLIIDYGYTETQTGETLQAVRNHRFVDPLDAPGESDLTAQVDFTRSGARDASRGCTSAWPRDSGGISLKPWIGPARSDAEAQGKPRTGENDRRRVRSSHRLQQAH